MEIEQAEVQQTTTAPHNLLQSTDLIMDNESTETITNVPTPLQSYSQALIGIQELRRTPHPDLTRLIDN